MNYHKTEKTPVAVDTKVIDMDLHIQDTSDHCNSNNWML